MFIKYFLLLSLPIFLYATNSIKSTYYVDSEYVMLRDVIPQADSTVTLFKIKEHRHSKKISSKEFVKILDRLGFKDYSYKGKFVRFIKKSPIETSKIMNALKEYYEQMYETIDIRNIEVQPREYMRTLPKEYTIKIKDRDYLQKSGTISIRTSKNKKYFFNYSIDALIDIHVSRKKIKKGSELSNINTSVKKVVLDRFKSKPLQLLEAQKYQAKHHIAKESLITHRDIQELRLIRRDQNVNITLLSERMNITFSAQSLQSGKLNDIIKVQKSNGKILKVRVTGKNRAEMQ
ncbi:flagellar basal body P-ring formation chaperone FlgA [Sulfurimonas sp.]|nr:flagellar basal body P-ring formation chaperone FlgA [Sulfurimonas sp.]